MLDLEVKIQECMSSLLPLELWQPAGISMVYFPQHHITFASISSILNCYNDENCISLHHK
jgi:hypothetical protein